MSPATRYPPTVTCHPLPATHYPTPKTQNPKHKTPTPKHKHPSPPPPYPFSLFPHPISLPPSPITFHPLLLTHYPPPITRHPRKRPASSNVAFILYYYTTQNSESLTGFHIWWLHLNRFSVVQDLMEPKPISRVVHRLGNPTN